MTGEEGLREDFKLMLLLRLEEERRVGERGAVELGRPFVTVGEVSEVKEGNREEERERVGLIVSVDVKEARGVGETAEVVENTKEVIGVGEVVLEAVKLGRSKDGVAVVVCVGVLTFDSVAAALFETPWSTVGVPL